MSLFFRKERPYIIAEIGINHNGDLPTAISMIESAALAGADAVKFQSFVPELLYSKYTKALLETGREEYADTGIHDFFEKYTIRNEDLPKLKKCADDNNVLFLSAPFDIPSFEFLENIGVKGYKIASSEVTNYDILACVAKTGKPVVMSTGMTNFDEIAKAVDILKRGGCDITLLHCVALYPVPEKEVNLSRIETLKAEFGLPVGFSDHSPDIEYAAASAWMGAPVIEKHFTLSREFDCPDGNVSVTPEQINALIKAAERIWVMRGNGDVSYGTEEEKLAKTARRSIFALHDIPKGSVIGIADIAYKRPGTGIPCIKTDSVIGRKTTTDIPADYLIREDYLN